MNDLRTKTIRGGLARLSAQGGSFVLRFVALMILARLLTPQDFGLVGMVTAFTGVLNLFRDFGLSTATVQRATITEAQLSTMFWVNVLVGIALTVLMVAAAPVVAIFYHEPRLMWITVGLASGFLFNAAGVQHSALMQRQLRFTAMAVINVIALITSSAAGVLMAKLGYGYWALVVTTITLPLVTTVACWFATGWMPGVPQRQIGLKSMMRFGGTLTLNGLVVYVAYNFEKVLLGRFWGAGAIGIYGRAYQLVNIPTENLNSAAGEVALSALSRLQDDPPRFKSYFLKGYGLTLALTVPLTLVCAIFAEDVIHVLLGPQWSGAIPVFQLLTPTILAFAMINPFAWFLFATGKVERSLKIALVIAPLVIAGYVLGLPYGPRGVAVGYSAAISLWVVPHILWCIRGTAVSFREVAQTIGRPLIAGLSGAAAVLVLKISGLLLPYAWLRLCLGTAVFLGVYGCTLVFVLGQKAFYAGMLRTLKEREHPEERPLAVAQ